jgi:hypothetical protein
LRRAAIVDLKENGKFGDASRINMRRIDFAADSNMSSKRSLENFSRFDLTHLPRAIAVLFGGPAS